jgi:hypothetical protein
MLARCHPGSLLTLRRDNGKCFHCQRLDTRGMPQLLAEFVQQGPLRQLHLHRLAALIIQARHKM